MKFTANPRQALQVFSMLFGETPHDREPMWSKAIVDKPEDRKGLLEAKLVRSEKRGRANHLVLNDAAWDWAVDHLDAPLALAPKAAPVLHNVLAKLALFLRQHDHSLEEFVRGSARESNASENPGSADQDLEAEVRRTCLELTHGKLKQRVRLKDLRRRISAPRAQLDAALLHMQRSGTLVLMRLDNPAEVTTEDEAAALDIAGNARHLLYLEV